MFYDPNYMPERPLDPPEDRRKTVFICKICEEPIREGDDYFDIPGLGPCCEECIGNAKRFDAELDYPEEED